MTDNYETSDWGQASLKFEKKGFKSGVTCYGTIKAVEKKFVLFEYKKAIKKLKV